MNTMKTMIDNMMKKLGYSPTHELDVIKSELDSLIEECDHPTYYGDWKVRKDGKALYRKVGVPMLMTKWITQSEPCDGPDAKF
jgi:hypothetical protein